MTRIAGLPNTESNRALDMYMKTRYLAERKRRHRLRHRHADLEHHGRDVHAAALSRAGDAQSRGRRAFRRLGRQFRRAGHVARTRARTARATACTRASRNSSTCRSCSRCSASFADVQTADMLHLPRPAIEGGKPHITAAPASPELKAYVETLVEPRAEAPHLEDRSLRRQHAQDHRRRQKGRARYAPGRSLRPAAATPRSAAPSRTSTAAWEEDKDRRLTQLVFCDLSTPNPDRFNVYDEIRDKLIAKGIPRKGNRLYP